MSKVDLRDLTRKRGHRKRSIRFKFLIIFEIAIVLLVIFVPLNLISYKKQRTLLLSSAAAVLDSELKPTPSSKPVKK